MFGETGDPIDGEEQLTVDLNLYGLEAVFRACYAFTDRCYMFLRPGAADQVTVVFRKRRSEKTLSALIEDFANQLVDERVRVHLAAETKQVREMIVAQAFAEGDL